MFRDIPNIELYRPLFSPWLDSNSQFHKYYQLGADRTLVSPDRCFIIFSLLNQATHVSGNIWECGVYKGGTAAMIANFLKDSRSSKSLYLFDTFKGMPKTDADRDWHKEGDFSDTSIEAVREYVGCQDVCVYRKGFIPESFAGLEGETIALAHIDVDIYQSIIDCLNFIWPRLSVGGFVIFDDYGWASCPGARRAVDDYFIHTTATPVCLPTGQAIVFKSQAELGAGC